MVNFIPVIQIRNSCHLANYRADEERFFYLLGLYGCEDLYLLILGILQLLNTSFGCFPMSWGYDGRAFCILSLQGINLRLLKKFFNKGFGDGLVHKYTLHALKIVPSIHKTSFSQIFASSTNLRFSKISHQVGRVAGWQQEFAFSKYFRIAGHKMVEGIAIFDISCETDETSIFIFNPKIKTVRQVVDWAINQRVLGDRLVPNLLNFFSNRQGVPVGFEDNWVSCDWWRNDVFEAG